MTGRKGKMKKRKMEEKRERQREKGGNKRRIFKEERC